MFFHFLSFSFIFLHYLSFSFIFFVFVGCSKSDFFLASISLRFLLTVLLQRNQFLGPSRGVPIWALFSFFSSFFFSPVFFFFVVHFLHFFDFLNVFHFSFFIVV